MTTNKPKVVAVLYRDGSVLTKQECGIAFDTCCNVETPLIRLSDYERLQAECENLRKDAERYRFIRDTEELPMNLMRLEMIGDVMDAAIDVAMQETSHDD